MPDANSSAQVQNLLAKLQTAVIPEELKVKVTERLNMVARLTDSTNAFDELDRLAKYTDWIVSLPWDKRTEDILNLKTTGEVLDRNHFGLTDIKERILEFVAVMSLSKGKEETIRAPILCFVGLAGTGKTTIAKSIAQALGRKFYRIPFGGMGDPRDLRGQSKTNPEAEPGKVIKALKAVDSKNPVILLDEVDRVSDEGQSSIMGVLVELLDPEQNAAYIDHYIDYPFDLSEVLFVATANNTTHIATAVLDRLEVIQMPSYSDQEKISIAKNYMFPQILKESGLPAQILTIQDEVWPVLVRPLGFDSGMRTLERTVQGVVRKVAKEIIEGKISSLHLTNENIKPYLPSY